METTPSQSSAAAGATTPAPAPMPASNAPPPFLVKTYDMVDDPSTDKIVSWSPTNNSFVVWDSAKFAKEMLPKYFKHSNFSSFVRQLNTYGFRKVDPDRWEFANEGFLRGQKHLLKSITRRKPAHAHPPQQQQANSQQSSTVNACVEVGKFGIEEEVEQLKRDKNVLMQELVRLRQQQQTTDVQLQATVQRLQGMEQRQQQMMSFLAKAVNSPGFLAQFMQQQPNDGSRLIAQANKKRRLKQDDDFANPMDGQIVKYQPLMNEAAKTMIENFTTSTSPLNSAFDAGIPSNCASGAMLREVSPTFPTTSEILQQSTLGGAKASDVLHGADLFEPTPENSDALNSVAASREIPGDIVDELFSDALEWDDSLLDGELLEVGGDPFWADLGQSQLPAETETDSRLAEDGVLENGWDKTKNMKELTEQMGLLSSEPKKS